jgi:hypothetical protein
MCEPPLVACADGCADLENDLNNCGACGVHCPTELCVNHACVGDPVGHLVTIGMSYAESHASSQRVLGNALFRSLHNPTRILEYNEYASQVSVAQIHAIVQAEAQKRNRAYELASASAASLPDILESGHYDVLLVHDGPTAPPGALGAAGAAIGPAIADFSASGGTVVATATGAGSGEMCELLTATGILSCAGFASAMESLVHNALPSDVIGNGVVAPFAAKPITSAIVGSEPAGPNVAHVFLTNDGAPVVIHRVVVQPPQEM